MSSLWCCLAAIAGLSAPGAADEPAKIAQNGRAAASIVLPDSPSPTERFAAEELQRYVAKITGAQLPIVGSGQADRPPRLLIGATPSGKPARAELAQRDAEAFVVRRVDDDLLLVGATDRGTLYAAYDFLEDDLGCRWLGPGPDWEFVPSTRDLSMPRPDRQESPAMRYRFLRMIVPAEPGSWESETTSWAVKQKINIASGWPAETLPESLAGRGGFRGWMSPHLMIPHLLPPSRFFDDHPEWYALVGGERRRGSRMQLCTTNNEVVRRIADGVRRLFDARPEMEFVAMGQEDGTAFCECSKCAALDTGDRWRSGSSDRPVITERWLSFVNAVARRVEETHPGKKVYTLAYHQTFRPPDPQKIRPAPNVMIQVVNSRPNYVCFVHRFQDADCPHHVEFCSALEDWAAMTPAGVLVYEYDPHSTFCSMPYPAPYKFVGDIQYLHRVGVIGYEGQSAPSIWGTYGINHYAIAKATWDPNIDAEDLVADYCRHAFGRASRPMQEFLRTIDRALVAADHTTDGIWSYMTAAVMAEARSHLDAAHAAARDVAVQRRLRAYEIGFHYGELGSDAWRTAQEALAERDSVRLRRAIDLAEAAAKYCQDQQRKAPHYAAAPGKLITVHAASWRRRLAQMK